WRDGRTIAVILSGVQHDGVSGALAVCRNGGAVIAQDPDEALFPNMPIAVLDGVPGSVALPVAGMASRVGELIAGPAGGRVDPAPNAARERSAARARDAAGAGRVVSGATPKEVVAVSRQDQVPSDEDIPVPVGSVRYGCPDCGGVLTEIVEGDHLRFRCRV